MTDSRWIRFVAVEQPPTRKTGVWAVQAKDGGVDLGTVSWYAPWRRYCFFPAGQTVFEPTCLRDISTYIDALMTARRTSHG